MANTQTVKGEWHDWVGELFEPVFGATIDDLVAHEEEPDNKPKVCYNLFTIKFKKKLQRSRKSLKKCLTESGKMIKLCTVKFQDIFTRPDEFLPDSIRWSDTFHEDRNRTPKKLS